MCWRCRVGCFNSRKRLSIPACKYQLLVHALKICASVLVCCLILVLNVLKYTLKNSVYYACLTLWCLHFCGYTVLICFMYQWWLLFLLLSSGDIHPNPGPENDLLSFMHWNLNSLTAHDSIRIPLIQSYNLHNKYDIIAITETALHSSVSDEKIEMEGYIPIRRDLSPGITHGGVMLYHKDSLPVGKARFRNA